MVDIPNVDIPNSGALSPGDLGIGRLFEEVRDAVVVADAATGRIVLWNPAAHQMFGYSSPEAVGLPVEVLVPQDLKPRHRAGMIGYLETGRGTILDGGQVVEVPARRKSGDVITVELSLNPIRDASVDGRYVMAIIRDVSERVELRRQATRRLQELEALYAADELLHRSLRLEDVVQTLADLARDILDAEKTTVLVWDSRHERLIPGATRGFSEQSVARLSRGLGQAIAELLLRTNGPIVLEDARTDQRIPQRTFRREQICALLHVPIQVHGEVFGAVGVNYSQPRRFSESDERLLEALAARASVAIENAREYQDAQFAATMHERQRLARDLHDAVSQTLFAAGLNARVLPHVWRADPDEGARCLAELQQLTWGALAEMRTVLVELRPAALTEGDLGDLLQQLAQAAAARAPQVEIHVRDRGKRKLAADVQVAFYRVAQEALNNVVKHADARHIEVQLRRNSQGAELQVTDDGCGFAPECIPAGHFGVGMMRERVQAIGGTLAVHSRPGVGTTLTMVWRAAARRPKQTNVS
jgi:PAS domain S-box-containing protein